MRPWSCAVVVRPVLPQHMLPSRCSRFLEQQLSPSSISAVTEASFGQAACPDVGRLWTSCRLPAAHHLQRCCWVPGAWSLGSPPGQAQR